jgi:hypothetical protein
MSNQKNSNWDIVFIVVVALCVGMAIGRFCPPSCTLGVRTFCQKLYVKFHPDSQKDTKTIIIDRETSGIPNLPHNDIFEQPEKKDCAFVKYVKQLFNRKSKEKPQTINDIVLH